MKFYLQTLRVSKFRMFEEQQLQFRAGFNLIIGKNGTGKTSILRAIRIAMSSFAQAFQEEFNELRPVGLRLDLVKDSSRNQDGAPLSTAKSPTTIACIMVHENGKPEATNLVWESKLNEKKSSALNSAFNDYARQGMTAGGVLPLTLFFSTGRLWHQANKVKFKNFDHRAYRGYLRSLNDNIEISNVLEWVSDLFTNGSKYPLHLAALKTALGICFSDWQNLGWHKEYSTLTGGELSGYYKGKLLLYTWLSDGQQNVVNIVLETLYRCSKLNPDLFGDANGQPLKADADQVYTLTPGVLLIDELDMHLHPEWQQQIVGQLKQTFPNIQIIATTHAPAVIQSCDADEIIDLASLGQQDLDDRESPKNLSSSYVMKEWQGVGYRATDYVATEQTFMNFYELVDKARSISEQSELKQLANQVRVHLDLITDPALSADMKLTLRGVPALNDLVNENNQ